MIGRGSSGAANDRARVLAADRDHLWHPYTPMDEWRRDHHPLVVVSAEGPWLELDDGRRVLDGNGSWWVSTLGHNHPRLVAALKAQADRLCHCSLAGIVHPEAALLAQELAAVCPAGLDQVFFTDDGSTAVEAAVKMALQYHGQRGRPKKTRFVALDSAFHGETIGAASLGGVEVFRRPFASVLFDCVHVVSPSHDDVGCAPSWGEAFDAVATLVEEQHETIAAVVVEPIVQGAGGMLVHPPAYLRGLRDVCSKHDVLLIADEVFTGYGRLGPMWACGLADVVPDILCTAKGFSGGVLPMAATVTSRAVQSAFDGGRARAFLYGHSYCGNPLGAAVAREVLAVYRDERVLEGIPERATRIAACFERLQAQPHVRGTRAIGMVGAADLRDAGTGYTARIGWRVYEEARKRGAYLRPLGDVVYVAPSLNIPLAALDTLLGIVEESVAAVG